MNDPLTTSLARISELAEQRAVLDEMRGSVAYKAQCPRCDGTGWMFLTSGRITTTGGHEVTASEMCPVARRCANGCGIPVKGRPKAPSRRIAAVQEEYGD